MTVQQLGALKKSGQVGTDKRVTVFICSNCARAGVEACARFRRPVTPAFPWPTAVDEVIVPCAGRLQPEHLLRIFEAGTDLLCVVACEEDNCHNLEGSCRATRRVRYVQGMLDEIGLGA
ncbi:MAG: hydrogenase iron-sulfur subunit, partial [Tepidisphaeraceae bacterium]